MKYYKIIVNKDTVIRCKEGENILQAMSHHKIRDIVYGCYGGGCGQCSIDILEGTYKLKQKMSSAYISKDDQIQGRVLACCVTPTSDIRIHVIRNKKK